MDWKRGFQKRRRSWFWCKSECNLGMLTGRWRWDQETQPRKHRFGIYTQRRYLWSHLHRWGLQYRIYREEQRTEASLHRKFTNHPDHSHLSEFFSLFSVIIFIVFVFSLPNYSSSFFFFFEHIFLTPAVIYLITQSGHCDFCCQFLCSVMLIVQLASTVFSQKIISLINILTNYWSIHLWPDRSLLTLPHPLWVDFP